MFSFRLLVLLPAAHVPSQR